MRGGTLFPALKRWAIFRRPNDDEYTTFQPLREVSQKGPAKNAQLIATQGRNESSGYGTMPCERVSYLVRSHSVA